MVGLIGLAVLIGFMSWRITSVAKERDAALVVVGTQKKSLDEITGANLQLQDTINEIVNKQKTDEATRLRIEEQVRQVNEAIQSQRRELRKLGETNATVKSYLDTPVPPELRSLYNRADAAATASGSVQNLVPATPGQASGPTARPKGEADKAKR
jgi:predicted  nucleic acid-binding Zn-ribbon protein